MNRHRYAVINHPGADHCPATAFVRALLAHCREGKKDPAIVIMQDAAKARAVLTQMGALVPQELSYEHLSAAERSLPDVAFRYAVMYNKDNKTPLLFAAFQVFTLTARSFNLHKERTFVKHILGLFLNLRKARVVVSGNALRTDVPCYCYDPQQIGEKEALETIATLAERIADEDDASAIILTGTDNISKVTAENMAGMGYSMPWEDNVMDMAIEPGWATLQDYLAALSRKYKTRANKLLADVQPLTVVPISEADIARYQPDINRLFGEVINKQPFVFTASGAEYITALKKLHKDDFEINGFFEGGKLVAFYSAFIGADDYELYYVGFDMELNAKYQLYFNILLSGLERAIVLRKKVLKLGRTSFDAKASLGAKPRRKDYLIKLHHIPDAAIKWFSSYFSSLEEGKWRQRNPLKERAMA